MITLLSDVSITADAATIGGHSGLDYLPGSLFLGTAAAEAKRRGRPFSPDLFLSGKVRFLDALPLIGNEKGIALPLCFHKEKGIPWEGKEPMNLLTTEPHGQPKQWRSGYMNSDGKVLEIQLESRMKTAIDRRKRRSSEAQLFGYESIPEGTQYQMAIQADNGNDLEAVTELLSGNTIRLGRSKSAEYGAALMEEVPAPKEIECLPSRDNMICLQLMSDLALTDAGMPVLIPEGRHFGIERAILLPDKTFLRSRRYSPWNAFHNCRTTERQVLCKGGVISFRVDPELDLGTLSEKLSRGVGLFREEGFGQVTVNPLWLITPPKLDTYIPPQMAAPAKAPSTLLTEYLKVKTENRLSSGDAFSAGLEWAKKWNRLSASISGEGKKVPGKSQWGTIRELSVQSGDDPGKLLRKLEEFCTMDLRSRVWTGEVRKEGKMTSLYAQMSDDVKSYGEKAPAAACLALFHASVEMSRNLSRKERKEASGR
jgi:CRISPR-associated protein Csx10